MIYGLIKLSSKRDAADRHNYERWLRINANPPRRTPVNKERMNQARAIVLAACSLNASCLVLPSNTYKIRKRDE